ncbi:helix-turn-helix domain-containing protein [Methylobacterium variabile]|jgi:AraC family transcriptional regulator, positive regulator of tynA and feaB|nr:helix-turn-helix domain-containing protein [Methylobacterium variabile]
MAGVDEREAAPKGNAGLVSEAWTSAATSLDHGRKGHHGNPGSALVADIDTELDRVRAWPPVTDQVAQQALKLPANRVQVGELVSLIVPDRDAVADVEKEPRHSVFTGWTDRKHVLQAWPSLWHKALQRDRPGCLEVSAVRSEDRMRTIFSTEHIRQQDKFHFWMDFVRRTIITNDALPACRENFDAELGAMTVGETNIALVKTSTLSVTHTRDHARRLDNDDVFVFMPLKGQKFIEQDGRCTILAESQLALIDPRFPHRSRFSEGCEALSVHIERQKLENRLGTIHPLTARPIKPDTAEGSVAAAYLTMISSQAGNLGQAAQGMIEAHLLDLIALSLTQATGRSLPRPSRTRSMIRMKVRAEIQARLSDPSTDAEAIASAAGVSVKYANAILADDDTSIRRLLQDGRLARCRQALEDPAQLHRSVSEIAYGWGFSDMTHFGRRFKAAYGLLPSECRRRAPGRARSGR